MSALAATAAPPPHPIRLLKRRESSHATAAAAAAAAALHQLPPPETPSRFLYEQGFLNTANGGGEMLVEVNPFEHSFARMPGVASTAAVAGGGWRLAPENTTSPSDGANAATTISTDSSYVAHAMAPHHSLTRSPSTSFRRSHALGNKTLPNPTTIVLPPLPDNLRPPENILTPMTAALLAAAAVEQRHMMSSEASFGSDAANSIASLGTHTRTPSHFVASPVQSINLAPSPERTIEPIPRAEDDATGHSQSSSAPSISQGKRKRSSTASITQQSSDKPPRISAARRRVDEQLAALELVDPEEAKRKREFLERNRQAALKCRQRKREVVSKMETRMEELAAENARLQTQAGLLKDEVMALRTVLAAHTDCTAAKTSTASKVSAMMGSSSTMMARPATVQSPTNGQNAEAAPYSRRDSQPAPYVGQMPQNFNGFPPGMAVSFPNQYAPHLQQLPGGTVASGLPGQNSPFANPVFNNKSMRQFVANYQRGAASIQGSQNAGKLGFGFQANN